MCVYILKKDSILTNSYPAQFQSNKKSAYKSPNRNKPAPQRAQRSKAIKAVDEQKDNPPRHPPQHEQLARDEWHHSRDTITSSESSLCTTVPTRRHSALPRKLRYQNKMKPARQRHTAINPHQIRQRAFLRATLAQAAWQHSPAII